LLGRLAAVIAPRILSLAIFLAGAVLLFSGATPAEHSRIELLRRLVPLPLLELSHFLNSILGLLLLIVARGLHRRVETAWYVAIGLLVAGIALSLVKGFDYEAAIMLGLMLAALLPCRQHFYRHGAMLTQRFTLRWLLAIALVVGCAAWLSLFTYQHVEYRDELWWQFAFQKSAPRSLRALAGTITGLLIFASWRLMRIHKVVPALPSDQDLSDARRIVECSPRADAHLALLGDKRFFFNADRTAMIMYGVEGRSWVAMGDPLGEPAAQRELAWDFLDFCDEGGRWPVFYQVDQDSLSVYVEMGLSLNKLGEEARVPLADFSLEGVARRSLRRSYKQLTDEGCSFEIVDAPLNKELVAELKRISDAWLAEKHTAEKGFSMGFFHADYIQAYPVALVRQADRLIAFANIWQGAERQQLSIDLMRHVSDAPRNTMDYLFISLMLWGRAQGYQQFSLGMAPLSGIEHQRRAPLWTHLAALAFQHGEHFYNFQGLRNYKEKFHPQWRAKYLASRGGLATPLILTNVATLISGGLKKLVSK
jgi:phosphatidylglycerol lysyltransferase